MFHVSFATDEIYRDGATIAGTSFHDANSILQLCCDTWSTIPITQKGVHNTPLFPCFPDCRTRVVCPPLNPLTHAHPHSIHWNDHPFVFYYTQRTFPLRAIQEPDTCNPGTRIQEL
jgi:hypothetical protein